MKLMLSKHLTLTTSRFITVLTKIVQIYVVLLTLLRLLSVLNQIIYNLRQLIYESTTISKLSFDNFTTIGTFWLQLETLGYAAFTVQLRTVRTHGGLCYFAIAYLAIEQFLKSIFLLSYLRKMGLDNFFLFHKNVITIKIVNLTGFRYQGQLQIITLILRMSQYQHTFSHYVNHILNKSPSKTTFSFSKADRFPRERTEQPPLLPTNSACQYHHELHHNTNRSPTRRSPRKSPKKQRQQLNEACINQSGYYSTRNQQKIPSIQREVDYILRKIQRRQNSKSPNQSPYKKHYKEYRTSPTRAGAQNNKNNTGSPRKQRKLSPYKTVYTEMLENNHPSKNISITGYYPVGIEINAEGRYPSSKIRNVTGSKFSPIPFGRMSRQRSQDQFGPGFYTPFSEFGPG